MQRAYKKRLAMHNAKKDVLVKIWEKKVAELIKTYQAKGKKQAGTVRKLKQLWPEIGIKIMHRFYDEQKLKYLAGLKVWFRTMKTPV